MKNLVLRAFLKGFKGEILRRFVPQNDSGELFDKLEFGGEAPLPLVKPLGTGIWFLTRPLAER